MTTTQKVKVGVVTAMSVASISVMSIGAFAAPPGDTRPGWGFGDQNHTHTGPPGQSVSVNPSSDVNVVYNVDNKSNTGANTVTGNKGDVMIATGNASSSFSIKTWISDHILSMFH